MALNINCQLHRKNKIVLYYYMSTYIKILFTAFKLYKFTHFKSIKDRGTFY